LDRREWGKRREKNKKEEKIKPGVIPGINEPRREKYDRRKFLEKGIAKRNARASNTTRKDGRKQEKVGFGQWGNTAGAILEFVPRTLVKFLDETNIGEKDQSWGEHSLG